MFLCHLIDLSFNYIDGKWHQPFLKKLLNYRFAFQTTADTDFIISYLIRFGKRDL